MSESKRIDMEKHDRQGFMLIEVMIVIAMISILTVPLIYWELTFTEQFYSDIYGRNMVEAGNRSLEWIARDLRNTTGIKEQSINRLVLKSMDGTEIEYAFDKKNRTVIRSSSMQNTNPVLLEMAHDVDNFTIGPVDPETGLVCIRIDLSRGLLKNRKKVSLHGTAYRRMG